MSLQRLDDILVSIASALRGAKMSELIERVNRALYETLAHSHVDGYFYLRDEWRLTRLWYEQSSNCYYALVEIDSPKPDYRIALYEIDANDENWGTEESEFAICVGRSTIEVAEECQEISLGVEV